MPPDRFAERQPEPVVVAQDELAHPVEGVVRAFEHDDARGQRVEQRVDVLDTQVQIGIPTRRIARLVLLMRPSEIGSPSASPVS